MASLRERREAVVREHMESENRHEFDVTLGTFDHPRYEIIPTGEVHDGPEEVMRYFKETRTAFPDQRNELIALHHADDAVIAEFNLLGATSATSAGSRPPAARSHAGCSRSSSSRTRGMESCANGSISTRERSRASSSRGLTTAPAGKTATAMNQQRYFAYRSLLAELGEWRLGAALDPDTYEELCDAAEGLLLARAGERPRSRSPVRAPPCSVLALQELDEQNASWLLDALLACGPQVALSDAARRIDAGVGGPTPPGSRGPAAARRRARAPRSWCGSRRTATARPPARTARRRPAPATGRA